MKNPTTGARKTTRQKRFKENPIQFQIRLEPVLYERIRARAMKNRNSLCLEIHQLIEKGLED